jgi:hypothetical protein
MYHSNNCSRDIAVRCKETWEILPNRLQYEPGCWKSNLAPIVCLRLAEVYLTYLQTLFHIYRLMDKRDGSCSPDLIQTCSSIIETTLQSGGFRNRAVYHQHHSFRASTVSQSRLFICCLVTDTSKGLMLRITQCNHPHQRTKNCKENHDPSTVR